MDYKIEVVAKNVTRGDLDSLVDYLNEQGDDFDAKLGDYTVRVWKREGEGRSWFYGDDDDE